jgi:hypothetical protein
LSEHAPFSRLSSADIAVLGRYWFGSRWQTALSSRLGISRRMVSYWLHDDQAHADQVIWLVPKESVPAIDEDGGGWRRISRKCSERLARAVAEHHRRRRSQDLARYIAMVNSLSSPSARTLMLRLLAEEIEVPVEAVSRLAREVPGPSPDEPQLRY